MPETLQWLNAESLEFPPLDSALSEPNGLLAIGGDLSEKRLLTAYANAIFPWFNDDEPILWWSPSPRAIIYTDQIRINKSLRKVLNRQQFQVTINHAFEQVISFCADAPFRKDGTWINQEMLAAYQRLHQLGYAHSVEVWHQQQLVGGLYGVAINGYFSGESMFYRQSNASKVALVALTTLLAEQGVSFIDCQITNPFLASMGCVEIPREQFISLQQQALKQSLTPRMWQPRAIY